MFSMLLHVSGDMGRVFINVSQFSVLFFVKGVIEIILDKGMKFL